jgi:glycosyltransferase involved in cell wall biosynthesis
MKILFAPQNIASMPAITARGFNLMGHRAKCLSFTKHMYLGDNADVIYIFSESGLNFRSIRYFFSNLYYVFVVIKWIVWADVIHWTVDNILPFNFDLRLIKFLKKKRFIEWVGSDIRIPEVLFPINKYYKEVFINGSYEYPSESLKSSYIIQEKFAKYGFVPVLVPEMQLYLKPGLFSKVHTIQYRAYEDFNYDDYVPSFNTSNKITIVHAPSAVNAKGSKYIEKIIKELQLSYDIEFVKLHKVPRSEVLAIMQTCDIYIDQIIIGSYAAAAIEAMGFGKPTVAFIMQEVFEKGLPDECPVVNANIDTLKERLVALIENPEMRKEVGFKSRTFVQNHHSTKAGCAALLAIYS